MNHLYSYKTVPGQAPDIYVVLKKLLTPTLRNSLY